MSGRARQPLPRLIDRAEARMAHRAPGALALEGDLSALCLAAHAAGQSRHTVLGALVNVMAGEILDAPDDAARQALLNNVGAALPLAVAVIARQVRDAAP